MAEARIAMSKSPTLYFNRTPCFGHPPIFGTDEDAIMWSLGQGAFTTRGEAQQAFDALDAHDVVIGPVPDGGYYLLGMKILHPELFSGIAWSTDSVRALTLEKVRALGCSYCLLPMLTDVDTEEDWLQCSPC